MTWIDGVFVLIIILSCLWGVWRGFVREILSLIVWVVAFYVASQTSTSFTALSQSIKSPFVASAISFFIVFIVIVIIGSIFIAFINKMITATPLSLVNRALGGVFGIIRGLIIVTVIVWVGEATSLSQNIAWQSSAFVPFFLAWVIHLQQGVQPFLNEYLNKTPVSSSLMS